MSDLQCPKCKLNMHGPQCQGDHQWTCERCGHEFIVDVELIYQTECIKHDFLEWERTYDAMGSYDIRECKLCPIREYREVR